MHNKKYQAFINAVLSNIDYENYEIIDVDNRRATIIVDNNEYTIRTWNANIDGIDFTLFKMNEDHGEEVYSGFYFYVIKHG